MARRVFFSFKYVRDGQRAAQVRNIGTVEGDAPVSDNDWEKVTKGGDPAIERWIAAQMTGKSCVVVLIGAKTAGEKWINHEIVEGWNAKKGVVGIYIHKLKNLNGEQATKGDNPFDRVTWGDKKLSAVAKAYNPAGATSKEAYAWIKQNLANAVEEAVRIRDEN